MNNYKITNKKRNKTYFLNEEELINFFKQNTVQNWNIVNLTKQKRTRVNKILDTIAFVCFFALTILLTVYIIENFY